MLIAASGEPISTGLDMGDRSPMRQPSYYSPVGLPLTSTFAAYAELYKSQPWVFTLVSKLGTSTSRLPLKVYRRDSDTERSSARDTPYGQLIRNPNPAMGPVLLWNWVASTRELYGEAILFKLRDDRGRVRELHPMHPANVVLRRHPETGRLQYGFMAGSSKADSMFAFDYTEVVHFRGYNPDNTTRGVSPCEPLRQTLLSEDAMRRGQNALWKNGSRPSTVLSSPKSLTQAAIDRLSAQWDAAHSGVDSWGKTAVLEEGITPHILQLNAEEMQYIQGRHLNRDECCAVWDVPPPAVHILDRATFSNITEQLRSLYRDTMAPRLEAYEDTLATQLAPDFNTVDDELYAEFDMDSVLRGSYEARVAAKAHAIQTGQITPAESRAEENLPYIEGSDVLLVNAALIPMKAAQEQAQAQIESTRAATAGAEKLLNAPDAPNPDTAGLEPLKEGRPPTKSLSLKDKRALAGRLSRIEDVTAIDPQAWAAGLEDVTTAQVLLDTASALRVDVPTLRRWIAADNQLELQ